MNRTLGMDSNYINLGNEKEQAGTITPGEDFHTSFHLYEDHHKSCLLTKAIEMHFIEMPKFRAFKQKDIQHNPLHRWLS
ncbi:MAG: Rpn family recombination-promoting nuclease/putative transposase, partial [Treponema sp.]|nr:Rpn family recombination-promoting nuclease/putative transposase [Treponema sp.]